ncbi:THUMP domain-containing class I SAM-dependent RNA methyltransferase [Polaromonas naphthalenivorans]|uniref:Putative RNA methylase n=1 Tax=Polaromonas naphthalenivorans (strain CJ2) TaxID=365044 RepID=A1VTM9_POLNA|nr:THUMP domain-containing protein [Polaromonas naphthalenivorans]ABM39007.1 putative RNA methylase [Polaromonas naphthalenivorans CJ2]
MNQLQLFLPCAAGVENLLAAEVQRITGIEGKAWRAGVQLQGSWREALQLNLHSRLAQRVLIELQHGQYRSEQDLYNAAASVAWEIWFTPAQTFKVEITAQHSPLQSLNFAALKIKDAIADRFRHKFNDVRPSVDTRWPDVRVYVHLTTDTVTVYIDTSGEPLFKRGWREDKGDAPLKETLAAAMIAASGWDQLCKQGVPLYDPCCGSGTIVIEAAQIACNIAPGINRRFAFQKYLPFQGHVWDGLLDQAEAAITEPTAPVYGSDVSFRMVDFAERNAERAGVANAVQLRGGDALQRMPPAPSGVMLVNPPYGERIDVAGVAGVSGVQGRDQREQRRSQFQGQSVDEFGQPVLRPEREGRPGRDERNDRDSRDETGFEPPRDRSANPGREQAQNAWGEEASDFFPQLAAHWKKNYAGWTAHVLTPDLKLPSKMRLKESRRVPMWNGPIECRLFRFDMVAGSARAKPADQPKP